MKNHPLFTPSLEVVGPELAGVKNAWIRREKKWLYVDSEGRVVGEVKIDDDVFVADKQDRYVSLEAAQAAVERK